jgi:hypothetical protein
MPRTSRHCEAHELHNRGNEMKKLIIALCLGATPAAAQNYYGNDPFWDNYHAAQNGYNNAFRNGMMVQQQRANEAMINLARRRQGLPPCSLSLLGQWQGRPAC